MLAQQAGEKGSGTRRTTREVSNTVPRNILGQEGPGRRNGAFNSSIALLRSMRGLSFLGAASVDFHLEL